MNTQFYFLSVTEVKNETPDCVKVSFKIPKELNDKFSFIQGQYLTLKASINQTEVRRSYSICSSVNSNKLSVAIKKVEGGIFSTWANNELKVGSTIEAMVPQGKFFTQLNSTNQKKYFAAAAGSGITPILSIISSTLLIEPLSNFILLYSNKNISSIIFKEDLEALKNKYPQRLQVIHTLSQQRTDAPISFGRIDLVKMQQLSSIINWQTIDDYFICGPEEVIFCVRDFLLDNQIPKEKIHFELFTSSNSNAPKKVISKAVGQSTITIKKDGRTSIIKINPSQPINILDAALQQGTDLPYACKGGVCCTCKAKLIKGEVQMEVHWGLEDFEVEQNYILTCQSYPTTTEVEVDFDI